MAKYKVIKRFKRLSEGLKEYNVGDSIELNKADAEKLTANKLVEAVKKSNKKAPITEKGAIETK